MPPDENECGYNYDLIVIGIGPGGEAAAVQAAKNGARVAVIEKKAAFGGPTGLTSKAVREATKRLCNAIDQIGGDRRKQINGLWKRKFPVLRTEAEVYQAKETRDRIFTNNIDLFIGEAKVVDSFMIIKDSKRINGTILQICRPSECIELRTKYLCVATGSRPSKPEYYQNPSARLNFSHPRMVTATEMGNMMEVPKAVAILGGGIISVEYATVLSKLGVGVSLICKENEFLPFLEQEVREALKRRMRRSHVLFVTENVKEFEIDPVNGAFIRVALENPASLLNRTANRTVAATISTTIGSDSRPPLKTLVDRKLKVDLVLVSAGRDANSEGLGLDSVGCKIGKYGRILVDTNQRTSANCEIFAVGDVVGPPGLASSAQYQARKMVEYLFNQKKSETTSWSQQDSGLEEYDVDSFFNESNDLDPVSKAIPLFGENFNTGIPLTLWTIPEIASVGISKLEGMKLDPTSQYIEGYAYFKDMARGRLSGDMDGFMKIVTKVSKYSKVNKILGVFIFGEGANELVQLGSILVNSGATIDQVSKTPFAAVTLCGLFQMACDDAIQKIRLLD